MEFRIKIETQRNGVKLYIPQAGIKKVEFNFFKFKKEYNIKWYNLVHSATNNIELENNIKESYYSKDEALAIIHQYKKQHKVVLDREIISEDYEYIK